MKALKVCLGMLLASTFVYEEPAHCLFLRRKKKNKGHHNECQCVSCEDKRDREEEAKNKTNEPKSKVDEKVSRTSKIIKAGRYSFYIQRMWIIPGNGPLDKHDLQIVSALYKKDKSHQIAPQIVVSFLSNLNYYMENKTKPVCAKRNNFVCSYKLPSSCCSTCFGEYKLGVEEFCILGDNRGKEFRPAIASIQDNEAAVKKALQHLIEEKLNKLDKTMPKKIRCNTVEINQ